MKGNCSGKIIKRVVLIIIIISVITAAALIAERGMESPEKLLENMTASINKNEYNEAAVIYKESFISKYQIAKKDELACSMRAAYYFAEYMDYNLTTQPEKLFTTEELQEKRERLAEWESWLGKDQQEELLAVDTLKETYLKLTEKLNDYYNEVFRGAALMKGFYQSAIITMNANENGEETPGDLESMRKSMEEEWKEHKLNRDSSLYDLKEYDIDLIHYYYQIPKGVEIQQLYRCADAFIDDFGKWSAGTTKEFMESPAYGTLEERIKAIEEYEKEFKKGSKEFKEIDVEIKTSLAKKYQEALARVI